MAATKKTGQAAAEPASCGRPDAAELELARQLAERAQGRGPVS